MSLESESSPSQSLSPTVLKNIQFNLLPMMLYNLEGKAAAMAATAATARVATSQHHPLRDVAQRE